MKKILFVILGCIVAAELALLHGGNASIAATNYGKIQIVTKDVNIGEVDKGKMFDYKIEVKNAGTEDLIIENVYSSCGCLEVTDKRWPNMPVVTNIKIEPVIVKPNSSIYIAVRLDTNKVSGEFEKILHVISNDPETKDATWKIKGVVVAAELALPKDKSASRPGLALGLPSSRPGLEAVGQIVMLFYSPGCNECKEVMENYLPKIKEKYGDKIVIINYNIDNPESFE